jgi:ribosomal protein S3
MVRSKSESIKSRFETFFDGCYGIDPHHEYLSNTYSMGICKLEFDEESNNLTVHLRRPGLLIGKAGRTFNSLKAFLECEISIVEVKKF